MPRACTIQFAIMPGPATFQAAQWFVAVIMEQYLLLRAAFTISTYWQTLLCVLNNSGDSIAVLLSGQHTPSIVDPA
jgi:hypothetical protein